MLCYLGWAQVEFLLTDGRENTRLSKEIEFRKNEIIYTCSTYNVHFTIVPFNPFVALVIAFRRSMRGPEKASFSTRGKENVQIVHDIQNILEGPLCSGCKVGNVLQPLDSLTGTLQRFSELLACTCVIVKAI